MISENSARVVIDRWHKSSAEGGYRVVVIPTSDEFDSIMTAAGDEAVDVCLDGIGLSQAAAEAGSANRLTIETADGAVYLGFIVDADSRTGLTSIELT
jgi:phage baseplate assembly protein gpV